MNITVIGAGAMGSIYAGLLAEAGHRVWAVDLWAEHVAAIRAQGLRIDGPSGVRTVASVNATTDIAEAPPADLYVIATKASGVGPAARAIAGEAARGALVLTIQNGLGAAERIAKHMPTDNVLLGVADGFGAAMKGPGHAHHNAMNLIRIGEITGGLTARLEDLAELWRRAGFNTRAYADIEQLIWEKFICNVTFSGPCSVFQRSVGEVMDNQVAWSVALGCMREAHACGLARGVDFSFDDADAYVTAFGARMRAGRPSMLQDHEARRPSEIDAINGMVPVLGRELGIPTPYNDLIAATIRAREDLFDGGRS